MSKDKGAPPYAKIDVPALNQLAKDYAQKGYAWSDKDYADRFPEFPQGLNYAIGNANLNLTGAVDPTVQGGLNSAGLGMVDLGGANELEKGRNTGNILGPEQRDRNYFKTLLSQPMTQPRGDLAGLSGKNIAEIRAVESGNKISYDWANFGTKLNQYNAQQAQANALGQSIGRLTGGVAQSAIGALGQSQQSPYLSLSNYISPQTYNYAPSGGYYNPGFAPSQYGGTYEGNIGGQPVLRAEPVGSAYSAPAAGGSSGGGGF